MWVQHDSFFPIICLFFLGFCLIWSLTTLSHIVFVVMFFLVVIPYTVFDEWWCLPLDFFVCFYLLVRHKVWVIICWEFFYDCWHDVYITHNSTQNIFKFLFTISEMELDYYHQKLKVRVALQFAEQLKT